MCHPPTPTMTIPSNRSLPCRFATCRIAPPSSPRQASPVVAMSTSNSAPEVSATLSKDELQALPGVTSTPDPVTEGFTFQQTMLRIKDPKDSLDFYTRVLGMTLLAVLPFPSMKFTLYFLGYEPKGDVPEDPKERAVWMFGRPAVLELTHNWGTESDPDFKGYHNGNADPRGFGHIGINVPDVTAACAHFEKCGVKFVKKPQDGKMKDIAFITDPDGYWIEILCNKNAGAFVGWVDPTATASS